MKRILPLLLLACLALPAAAALPSPVGASYAKGAPFTVAGYEASRPALSGFPVLVRIAEDSPSGFSYSDLLSRTDGADIAFIDMDGNGLPFEIDTWDPDGTSLVWVRLPSMTNGTQFVMCWGSATSGKTFCSANPWGDYTGVWHMNEETAGVTTIHDSTDNALDGTTVASSSSKTDGKVGRARFITSNTSNTAGNPYDSGVTVDMTGDQTKLDAVNAIVPEFTASFWVRPQGNAQWWYFITRKASDPGPGWGLQQGSDKNFTTFRAYGGNDTDSTCLSLSDASGMAKQTWTKVDAVWMSDQTFKLYFNGAFVKSGTLASLATNGDQTKLALGGAMGPTSSSAKSGRGVYGDMDEIRLRAGSVSTNWIAADYATQTDASFLTPGAAEAYEGGAEPTLGVSATLVEYTNATLAVTVGSLGMDAAMTSDAAWVDATLLVSASADDFSAPLFAVALDRFATAPATVSVPLHPLALTTTYYAKAVCTNSFGVAAESSVISFATEAPGPVFTASVNTDHIVPDISLSFTSPGLGGAVTRITVDVSTSDDFTQPALTKTYTVNLAAMPTNVTDIALTGLPTTTPLHYRFTAVNANGYAKTAEAEAANPVGDGNNVWSGLSDDIDDDDAYVFAGGLPASGKTLYFTKPAGLSPVIDRDVDMPSLRFTNGQTESVDTTYQGGYHSCGYDFSGSGALSFTAEKPILQASKGTNVVRNPLVFNRSNSQTVYVTGRGGRLDLTGELMLPDNVSNTTIRVNGEGGEVHFGGPSADFMGRLFLESSFTLSLDHPNAMTNVNRIYFEGGWGSFTYLKNNTGAPMTFPRCTMVDNTTGWSNTRACYDGAPFLFPAATARHYDRGGNGTREADVFVKNLVVLNAGTWFNKYGNGTFSVAEETTWESIDAKHGIALYRGCFWPQTAAGLPPSGELYIPNDHAWRSTLGLGSDFNPMLDGSSTPRFFQTSKLACWGFTGFGGERTVCWNADPTLNLTNITSGSVAIPFGDSAHTNVAGKAYSDYYAYPPYFMFGNRSEFADGTILFMNPIRYELGQSWDATTRFESTNHVVAARLRGSLKLGTSGRTWNFSGNSFGGYLALEADNADFTGKVNVYEKGNLLVNSNLVAQAVTVQSGAGLGGTDSLETAGGTTVKSGGALFGGEWDKGGTLALGGTVTLESGSALRAEVGASNDRIGMVKLAPGSTLKLTAPVYVDVDTDPRVSPARGAAVKILDWSEASFDSGAAPTRADFEARTEKNADLRTVYLFTREDGLYVNYISERYPPATMMILR